jgi:hypothetical protein
MLFICILASSAMAQIRGVPTQVPQELITGRQAIPTPPPPATGEAPPINQQSPPAAIGPPPLAGQMSATQEQAIAGGDIAGGRVIPDPILKILANPHIDPDIAYILWQLSRRPLDDWTLAELGFVGQIAPMLVESALPIEQVQLLYKFWGLDPNNVFNPSLPSNWQSQSTAFNPYNAATVSAISSAECQVDPSQMLMSTFRSCIGGGQ